VPFKEAVNRAICAGLGKTARVKRSAVPKTIPHSFGFKPGIDLDKLNQLADELRAQSRPIEAPFFFQIKRNDIYNVAIGLRYLFLENFIFSANALVPLYTDGLRAAARRRSWSTCSRFHDEETAST